MPKEYVTFDKVLIALKQGKKANRKGWNGVNAHYIFGKMDGDKMTGLLMSLNAVIGAASLHNNDLVADDWEIF